MSDEEEGKPKKNHFKNSITVKLDEPVEWGEELITEIKIKRPRGKHIKNLGDDIKIGDMVKIASKCSGVSMGVFDDMSSPDVMKVADAVGDLL